MSGDVVTQATYSLAGEDHTLGNSLRFMLNKNPHVSFAGYSVPHPADELVNVRVQTTGTCLSHVWRGVIIAFAWSCFGAHPVGETAGCYPTGPSPRACLRR